MFFPSGCGLLGNSYNLPMMEWLAWYLRNFRADAMGSLLHRQVRKEHQLEEQPAGNTAGIALSWSLDPLLPRTDWLKRLCCLALG